MIPEIFIKMMQTLKWQKNIRKAEEGLFKKEPIEYKISVVVSTEDNPVSEEAFEDAFTSWVESRGWIFGGSIGPEKKDNRAGVPLAEVKAKFMKNEDFRREYEALVKSKKEFHKNLNDKCASCENFLWYEDAGASSGSYQCEIYWCEDNNEFEGYSGHP